MKSFNLLLTTIATITLVGCNYQINKETPIELQPQGPQGQKGEAPEAISEDQLSYQVVVDQVLAKRCQTCHSEAGGNKGSLNLETYEAVKKNIQDIRNEVSEKSMPPRRQQPLSEAQIKLVLAWIDAGANLEAKKPIEQTPTPTPTEPTPEPSEPVIVPAPTQPATPDPVPPVKAPPTTPAPPVIVPAPVDPTPIVIPSNPKEITFEMVRTVLLKPRCFQCHSDATINKGDVNLETYKNVMANLTDIYDDIVEKRMPRGKDKVLTEQQLKIFFDWYEAGATENGADSSPKAQTSP